MQKVILVIFIFCFFLFPLFSNTSFAQNTSNDSSNSLSDASQAGRIRFLEYAFVINTNEKNIKDGSIISYSKQERILSHIAYDPEVAGIVSRNVALTIYNNDSHQGLPIISDGIVYVLVSTKNGFIKKGDQITTSTLPGVGVKAIQSGYTVGTALEDYDNPNPNSVNTISVSLNLKHLNSIIHLPGYISNIFNLVALPISENPLYIFAYIIFGVILASFILLFLTFNHTAKETLKRNPTANQTIHMVTIFNIVMVCLIILTVFTLSFLLFRL